MIESRFKRICVFCGSSPGRKKSYQDAAIELGNELVQIYAMHTFFYSFNSSQIFTWFHKVFLIDSTCNL